METNTEDDVAVAIGHIEKFAAAYKKMSEIHETEIQPVLRALMLGLVKLSESEWDAVCLHVENEISTNPKDAEAKVLGLNTLIAAAISHFQNSEELQQFFISDGEGSVEIIVPPKNQHGKAFLRL